MLHLRRSALRVLSSSPSSFACRSRTITSLSSRSSLQIKPSSSSSLFQHRWASSEAAEKEDEPPISELQPTPQEEVENAISEDNAISMEDAAPMADTADATEVTEEAVPEAEATPIQSAASSVRDAASSVAGAAASAFSGGRSDRPWSSKSREELSQEPKETIYIGNLFFDVTENDLSKELSRFGKVEKVRMMRDGRGLSKGFGYVDFDTVEGATAAVNALHQQLFEGRRINVQYAAFSTKEMQKNRPSERASRPMNQPSKTLFIGNMSFEMTDRDLSNLFRGIRNVIDVRVAIDRRTGQPRGFAHADFLDVKSAQDAMKVLSDKETYGRKLRLDFSYGSSEAPKNQTPPGGEGSAGAY